jgi:hypothetical protein
MLHRNQAASEVQAPTEFEATTEVETFVDSSIFSFKKAIKQI